MTKKTKTKRKSVSSKKANPTPKTSKSGEAADQAQVLEALRESEELYRSIFELSPDGILTVDLKGVVTTCNPVFLEFIGYSEKEIIGKHFSKIPALPAGDIPLYTKMLASLIRGKITKPFEAEWIHKDGTIRTGDVQVGLIKRRKKIKGLQAIVRDLTEQKQTEQVLREEKAFTEAALNSQIDTFYVFRVDNNRPVRWNSFFEEVSGYSDEEISSMVPFDFYPETEHERIKAATKKILKTGQTSIQLTLTSKDGKSIPYEYVATLIKDEKGDPLYICSIGRDISERKQADEALRETRDTLATVMDSIDANVYVLDIDTYEVLFANKYIQESFSKGLVGKVCYDIFRERSSPCEHCKNTHLLDKEGQPTGVHRWEDQSPITGNWYENFDRAIRWHDGRFVRLQIAIDITERKLAEEDLRKEQKTTQNYLDVAGVMLVVLDDKGLVTRINKKGCAVLGYDEKDVLGKNWFDNFVPQTNIVEVKSVYQKLINNEIEAVEYYENPVITRAGEERIISWHNAILKDESGKNIGTLSSGKDITERKQAEAQLKLQSLALESAANAIVITDAKGNIQWANPAFSALIGYPLEEALGQNPSVLKSGQQDEAFYKNLWDTITAGEVWHGEIINKRKDGELYTEEMTIAPLLSNGGEISNFVAIKQNITERKQAEEALSEREFFLSDILDSIQEGISVLDSELNIIRINDVMNQWYPEKLPLVGKKCYACYQGRDEPCQPCPTIRCFESGKTERDIVPGLPGSPVEWIELYSFPMKDRQTGEVTGVVEFVRDITVNKKAEEELRQLTKIVEQSTDSIITTDLEYRITYINAASQELYGWRLDEVKGKNPAIFNAESLADDIQKEIYQTVSSGNVYIGEALNVGKDGSTFICQMEISPIFDDQGDISGYMGSHTDITELKQAEEELRESEERYRSFAQNFQGIAYRGGMDYIPTFFHGAVEEISGYPVKEILAGKPSWNLVIHPEDLPALMNEDEERLHSIPHYSYEREYRIVRKDGAVRWVFEIIQNICDDSGKPVFLQGAIYDITERKQAEEERNRLLESESQQRTIAETLSEVTLALTSHTDVSSVLEEILKQIRRIVPYETANIALLEGDALKIAAWYGYKVKGSEDFISTFTLNLSDSPMDVVVVESKLPKVITDVSQEPGWLVLKETSWIKSYVGIPICHQDRILGVIRLDGGEVGRFSEEDGLRLLPLASSAAVALENASLYEQAQQELIKRERAKKEIQKLNEELEQRVIDRTTKLKATNEELEAFSYSISHDLRAPLRAINGFSAILKENYGELLDEEGNRYLDILRSSTLKMDHLINDLLSLSRLGRREISFQPVNITSMAEQIWSELTKDETDRTFDYKIADCPIVEADNNLLEILLTNLLSNAVKFTRGRDPAVIEFGWLGEEDAPVYFVKDNGVGFNMNYVDNLFGPFQRLHTEKEFEGTGIGLAIVRRIAQRHGGRVWVEAEPDKGATFYFTLGK